MFCLYGHGVRDTCQGDFGGGVFRHKQVSLQFLRFLNVHSGHSSTMLNNQPTLTSFKKVFLLLYIWFFALQLASRDNVLRTQLCHISECLRQCKSYEALDRQDCSRTL